ncbi:MAG: DUF5684 domain-containing protein [Bacteroidota bacterium]
MQTLSVLYTLFSLALTAAVIAGMWRVFEKADQPGWAAIIPLYNLWVLVKISGKPRWLIGPLLLILAVPFLADEAWWLLSIVLLAYTMAFIYTCMGVARHFKRSSLYGLGLAIIPVVFYPLLGFGDASYHDEPQPAY